MKIADSNQDAWPWLDAAGTFIATVFAFLAFDDITSDWSASAFTVEYSVLTACAAWCCIVAMRLLRRQHLITGGISLVVLFAAAAGQGGIFLGTVPSWRFDYVATVAAVLWFLGLSFGLAAAGLWHVRLRRARA